MIRLDKFISLAVLLPLLLASCGCSLVPEKRQRDVLHNPFPQLKRIAVLPFYNQSSEPTVNTDQVAESYYGALQAIPGFEVLPVGVAKAQWMQYAATNGEPRTGRDFQQLAQQMGVEAVVVGSVTDYDPYYPPRMSMTVHWYAANEGFHPIPAGYGLPWGTKAEEQIPRRIAREAEFELARSQLATQTPVPPGPVGLSPIGSIPDDQMRQISAQEELPVPEQDPAVESGLNRQPPPLDGVASGVGSSPPDSGHHSMHVGDSYVGNHWVGDDFVLDEMGAPLPPNWPNATDLIPDPPSPHRPVALASHEPVLTHTRLYRGDDSYFTNRLADYVETGDDARPEGWQGYLKRSEDFIRFCCHLHISEMLEARGGSDQSEFILRWPVSRY